MGTIRYSGLTQLPKKTTANWIKAPEKDGWVEEDRSGATAVRLTEHVEFITCLDSIN